MLSGYGYFHEYLHRFKHDDTPECPSYPGRIQPDTLVEAMLSSEAAWNATSTFVSEVLIDLRSIERRRGNNKI
ncbi:hypothetical protein EVAR_8893_1 [Eumeta japonica]|uniref:Uncharacterized protein n=1 Tax=Eumeta variegata TaxID=151549 RepID=A0A4C1U071_EUMVA|nr:hypothetical protein EVAR_8893_1 [Eumeta japonica]